MSRPRLLDLFCGAGGASMGYHRAGFDVTGVDLHPQKHYPFAFIQADAIAASPPCQGYSQTKTIWGREHPKLIGPTRDGLRASGKPYVIENVPGAWRAMEAPVTLCGTMFGKRLYRHRLFESNVPLVVPAHDAHTAPCAKVGRPPEDHEYLTVAGHFASVGLAREVMGIDWMNRGELAQAIPPDYTEHIGRQLIERL
jgi:DNA (cytosine-5)-methyltransferase 1